MKTRITMAMIVIILPFLGLAQAPKFYALGDFSLLGRQIQSTVNGQDQNFRLFGLTLEVGMNEIEGLPSGMTFGLGLDSDQEIIKTIQGYDAYGQPVEMSDFQERRSDYWFGIGAGGGAFRLMATIGAQTRGHAHFFVNWDDGTTEEITSEYQFAGIPPEYIGWNIQPKTALTVGGIATLITEKFYVRANGTYNFEEKKDPILGRGEVTFRPNSWFGIGGSAEYAFLQGGEYGIHMSLGVGDDVAEKCWLAFMFGPNFSSDKTQGIGWAGTLRISFDKRHGSGGGGSKGGFKNL